MESVGLRAKSPLRAEQGGRGRPGEGGEGPDTQPAACQGARPSRARAHGVQDSRQPWLLQFVRP